MTRRQSSASGQSLGSAWPAGVAQGLTSCPVLYIMLYMSHATLIVSISEARARLPELAQLVMAAPQNTVIIEHRDRKERVVLTAESYLRTLEAIVDNWKKQTADSFSLASSMSSELTDDQLQAALTGLREEAAAAAASKLLRALGD